MVITQSPVLKAASSFKSAWREGSRSRPSCEPGGFWSGSKPSRTSKVRRCEISFANLSPFSHAVPIRGSGSPNQAESSVKKFICGGGAPTATLPVEGPAKNELSRTIMLSSHSPKPMVDQRGLSDTSPGNYCDDIHIRVCPCIIQESNILLSTKKIASCNGQSGYGNLLRSQSCWRLASCGVRNLHRASAPSSDK